MLHEWLEDVDVGVHCAGLRFTAQCSLFHSSFQEHTLCLVWKDVMFTLSAASRLHETTERGCYVNMECVVLAADQSFLFVLQLGSTVVHHILKQQAWKKQMTVIKVDVVTVWTDRHSIAIQER